MRSARPLLDDAADDDDYDYDYYEGETSAHIGSRSLMALDDRSRRSQSRRLSRVFLHTARSIPKIHSFRRRRSTSKRGERTFGGGGGGSGRGARSVGRFPSTSLAAQ